MGTWRQMFYTVHQQKVLGVNWHGERVSAEGRRLAELNSIQGQLQPRVTAPKPVVSHPQQWELLCMETPKHPAPPDGTSLRPYAHPCAPKGPGPRRPGRKGPGPRQTVMEMCPDEPFEYTWI